MAARRSTPLSSATYTQSPTEGGRISQPNLIDYLPARFATADATPWIPSSTPGKSARPLRFLAGNRGFVELLRMEPGVVMPLHRHSGEIHAFNLSGRRKLCTGEVVGPGDYVYEPPGNVDWWKIIGDEGWWCW